MAKLTKKQRFARAAGVAAAGLAVALAITLADQHLRTDWGFYRCATGGAFLSGLIFAGSFGRKGKLGWFYAGMGFAGATIMGAMFAVLLLPFDEAISRMGAISGLSNMPQTSLMGPAYVVAMMMESIAVAIVWLGSLAGIHLVTQHSDEFPEIRCP